MCNDIKKLDIKKRKYKESKTKTFPPKTFRYCNFCQRETEWNFNPTIGHSQCSNCGLRKVPTLKNLIDCEGNIIKKDKKDKKHNKKEVYRYRNKDQYRYKNQFKNQYQTFLTKFLNKKIKCVLINSNILEGVLIGINQYEIILMVENEQIIVFKNALLTVIEKEDNS